MSLVKVQGNVSGTGVFTVAAPNSNTDRTLTLPDSTGTVVSTGDTATVTPAMLSQKLTSGTAVSASGTSVNFTDIPLWVKRITIMLGGVSLSGTAHLLVQAGVSSTPTTSGYNSTSSYALASGSASGGVSSTAGFIMYVAIATYNFSGHIVLTNVSGNLWVSSGLIANSTTTPYTGQQAGNVTLGGTLGMVRITTSNGTDTFDAGTINIIYEG